MSDFSIQHVSDTAFLAAQLRAIESARPDALFVDSLAELLAGERGRQLAQTLRSPMSAWQIAMRTLVIDRYVLEAIARGVDLILNLGAGLDTRPYRLELPVTLRWLEADYPRVQQFKAERLRGQTPHCRVERVSLDLADAPARRELFARLDGETERILVLTEGVVPYLSVEDAGGLANDLHAMRHVVGWIVDYVAPEIVRARRDQNVDAASAPFLFDPPDWIAFFGAHGWHQGEIRYLADEATTHDRPPQLPSSIAQSEGFRRSMGYALLEPLRTDAS